MTVKLFWTKPYRTICEANVVSADGSDIVLDQTVFYAESGGQESDHGMIGGYTVLKAEKRGDDIVYTLPDDHGLSEGDVVHVEIDWPRRYRLMRLHFAAELVLELVCRAVPGIEKIGAHIAEDKARIDFLHPRNVSGLFERIEAEVRDIVRAKMRITSAFSDEAAGRRYWAIDGLAQVPCGGTHLLQTGEVGEIELKRRNVGSGKERIEITLREAGKTT
jgi:Ser-tRNA(Ala) deacylase AlaX